MSATKTAETQDKSPAAPVVAKQPESPEKAAGPEHAAPAPASASAIDTEPQAHFEQSGSAPERARMVESMQHQVGNARVGRMFAPGVQRKAEVSSPEDAKIQRKCACGTEAGAAGSCAECEVKRKAQPNVGSETQHSTSDSTSFDEHSSSHHRPEITQAATGIQRFSLEDVGDFVSGVVGGAVGSPLATVAMLAAATKIASLKARIGRLKRATTQKGATHFTNAQWSMLNGSLGYLEDLLPLAVPALRVAMASLGRYGSGVFVVASVIVLPVVLAALLAALEIVLIILLALIIAAVILTIIDKIIDTIEEAERESGACDLQLVRCLENPWQPGWNRGDFGPRKDCGACYRECKHAGGSWPYYKCPD